MFKPSLLNNTAHNANVQNTKDHNMHEWTTPLAFR